MLENKAESIPYQQATKSLSQNLNFPAKILESVDAQIFLLSLQIEL
jgi:hypothetical protein